MSIVERAADLFSSISERRSEIPTDDTSTVKAALVERAMGSESALSITDVERTLPRRDVPRATLAPSRTVEIDLNKLRQQHLMTGDGERTLTTESFRRIKRHILARACTENAGQGTTRNLIMITSALPKEGKTFCAINLAISLAMEVDRPVLLVDADVAKPSLTSVLGIETEGERGLMDAVLDPRISIQDLECKTNIGKLSVLPAGTRSRHATEILASERMRALLQAMAEDFPDRLIVFDSPPLLVASEASALASRMGQIVVIVEAGRTTEMALSDALRRLESTNVVGVVLNKGRAPGDGLGGYGYGYGYGYDA